MNLYLIRHTKVAVDSEVCYGQTDVDVAGSFQVEQKKVTGFIEGVYFDKVYSSPLKRCRILAESVTSNTEIILDKRLMELNFGDWEMQTWDEIYFSPQGKVWMDNYWKFPTQNGESYPEMVKRISLFYNELDTATDTNVAIFTHAGVIRIFKSIIENRPIEELFATFNPGYGTVLKFVV
jgi:alpha-ribazole phosphatase